MSGAESKPLLFTPLASEEGLDDVVTICLYSKVRDDGSYHDGIFKQKENIEKIQAKLAAEAVKAGRKPPKIQVSLMLMPNWDKQQTFHSPDYIKLHAEFIAHAQREFASATKGISVIDAYNDAGFTDEQKGFLENLKSMGSVIDILKSRAVINNSGHRHLHLDSNTSICDWKGLYRETFGQSSAMQHDAFNASYCSTVYIAPHYKILYVSPGSPLPKSLKTCLQTYCEERGNEGDDKIPTANAIYDKVFTQAMHSIGVTHLVETEDRRYPGKGIKWCFYPADLLHQDYTLMPFVIPAQHKSWAEATPDKKAFDALPHIIVEDEEYDFRHFESIISTYTHIPLWHLKETDDIVSRAQLEEERLLFVDKHNDQICMTILAEFYDRAVQHDPETALKLLAIIPDTDAGNILSAKLFGVSVRDLHTATLASMPVPTLESLILKARD